MYMARYCGKEASYPRTFRLEFGSPRVATADPRGVGRCGAGLAGRCLLLRCWVSMGECYVIYEAGLFCDHVLPFLLHHGPETWI